MEVLELLELLENDSATSLRNGNVVVFETLFRDYYERLCNYANTMLNDMDEAEEMVQGTFLTLWEKRANVVIHTSMKSYLYRAVHNNCLNRIKHESVRRDHINEYRYIGQVAEYDSHSVLTDELERQINEAIAGMPPQCQKVFMLSRFENLTYAEIAEHLGLSIKTVDHHMLKALKILREKLKDYLPLLFWLMLFKN